MDFTRFCKTAILFENHPCPGVPGSFRFLRMCPWFTKITPERVGKTPLGPREWPAAALLNSGEVAVGIGGERVGEALWIT
jgi:hypothetical protein